MLVAHILHLTWVVFKTKREERKKREERREERRKKREEKREERREKREERREKREERRGAKRVYLVRGWRAFHDVRYIWLVALFVDFSVTFVELLQLPNRLVNLLFSPAILWPDFGLVFQEAGTGVEIIAILAQPKGPLLMHRFVGRRRGSRWRL